MGRHKKLNAAAPTALRSGGSRTATGCHSADLPGAGPNLSDVDPIRRATIERFQPKGLSSEMADLLRPWVVWCVSRQPFTAEQTDQRRIGQTYALLAEDTELHGNVDPKRAFRFSNVREHLERRRQSGLSANSCNSIRSNLYALGRCIAPKNYPAKPAASGRPSVKCAATEHEVRALEAAATRIGGVLGGRLRTILDLTTRAGARATELTQVRGRDIVEQMIDGRLILTVQLVNPKSGRIRHVPVLDQMVARRLAETAEAVGSGARLLGTPGNLKNAINKVFSTARERHGVTIQVTADQLRGYYVTRLSQAPVPVVLVQQIADMGNSHSLYEWTKNLEAPTLPEQVRMLAGALR